MGKKKMFEQIGHFLRDKRESRGISQTEVAEVLGVKPQFVSNWERGMSSPPLRLLKVVTRMYGIPDQELLDFMLAEQENFLRQELGLKKKRA